MPDVFAGLYCDDESIADRVGLDWRNSAHRMSRVAGGTDGVFSAGARWTLTSQTCDFAARGLQAGHVLAIRYATGTNATQIDDMLAINATGGELSAPYSVTLRRIGDAAGFGEPAGPVVGAASVRFDCWSARTNITNYGRQAAERWKLSGRDLDADGLREMVEEWTALKTLEWVFFFAARQTGATRSGSGSGGDDYSNKSLALRDELKAIEAILDARYGIDTSPDAPGPGRLTPGLIRLNVRGRLGCGSELG